MPVATPLMRKDCSPICDGAAAVILTSRPQPVQVAGLGSATETSSILDRERLACLDATRQAARIAYWRAGIREPRSLEGLYVEAHDAFNSLLPIDLGDLGLLDEREVVGHLTGSVDPYDHPGSGPRGTLPVNLSGGLKARGHPVGGTGLFQIAETYLQLTERFPNPRAQVPCPRIGLAHSIGGPGNNVYVTLLERSDSRRVRDEVAAPRVEFGGGRRRRVESPAGLHGSSAVVLRIGGPRVFAKLDHDARAAVGPEEVLAGQKVKLLVKDDGDHYFQVDRGRSFDLSGLVERVRRKLG